MDVQEVFDPQLLLQLGSYAIDTGITFELHSSRNSYFDWAKIRFTEQYQPELQLAEQAPATLQLGYGETLVPVFTGYLSKDYNSAASSNELLLKDDMLLLERGRVSASFRDVQPQEVLQYLLGLAGVQKYKLSDKTYQTRRLFVLRDMSLLQGIQLVDMAWGIGAKFFFQGGVFYWDSSPVQTQEFTFAYGLNILSLQRIAGLWELETICTPFVRHSQRIRVEHPQITGSFVVSDMVFRLSEEGFLRTTIRFM